MEIWKIFKQGKTNYRKMYWEISNQGRIRNSKGKILGQWADKKGYVLNRYHGYLHRLVAQNFIPNPDNKPEVNHINANKSDNRVENLEWVSHQDNMKHAQENGLMPSGKNHYRYKK